MSTATTDVAVVDDNLVGLEDVDDSDNVIPRLKIIHEEAVFEDNLTSEKHDKLTVVLLGLVKQRILWDPNIEDDATPLCKSVNGDEGHPDPAQFPWAASQFDRTALDPVNPVVACAACPLKEWGSDPKDGKKPWCSEQHTYPLLVVLPDGGYSPALLSLQRSSITPSRKYVSAFSRAKTPLFTVVTELSLTANKKGSVKFATPSFLKKEATDQALWPEFADQYRSIRDFIRTARLREDEDGSSPTSTTATAKPSPVPSSGGSGAKPPTTAAPSASLSDDDPVPF